MDVKIKMDLSEMEVKMKMDQNANKEILRDPESIKRNIVNHLEQILRFKGRVSKYIDDNYVHFMPNNTTVYIYLEEGKILEKQGYDMLNLLEWAQYDNELKSTAGNLKQSVWDLDVTNRILACDELFQCLEETSSSNEYMMALDLLKKMDNLIHCSPSKDVQKLFVENTCYDTIRVKYLLQFHGVKTKLRGKFQELVQFSEKQLPNSTCATIQVSKDLNQLQDTVLALFQAKYDVTEMCDFLMDKCLTPIITKPVNIVLSDDSLEHLKLQISSHYNSPTEPNSLPDYKQVFENIKTLFHCLENLNVLVYNDHHVFGIIGEHLSNRFLKLLLDECLMNAIPETLEEYQSSSLVEEVLQFTNSLADLYIINREEEQTLTKFTQRFETLFHNRFFRRLLESGRDIMQKDLQDMAVMAEKNTAEDVANNPFLFPRCMVSKSVLEFVKLLNRIIRQNGESQNEEGRFLSIISVLMNSYMTLVPEFHKEHLAALPQQAALFYNNCMFLHHWAAKNFSIPTVSNLVKNLSATGTKFLRQQVKKQLSILAELLKPSSGMEKMGSIPISLVHKCLVHLELLESLWKHVLPVIVYNKTMGELISSCCLILNQHVLTKEAITIMEAKVMADTFELFKTQAGSLFKVGQDLPDIAHWHRLVHLLEIIKAASLTEITEIWSMGELSEYFKADEILGLIRSLHPNTERRALALKKIF